MENMAVGVAFLAVWSAASFVGIMAETLFYLPDLPLPARKNLITEFVMESMPCLSAGIAAKTEMGFTTPVFKTVS